MQQQFARTGLVVIGYVSVRIRTNMHVEQKRFAVLDDGVGVLEVCLALADRLDLGSAQGHARFELLEKEVVVAGGPVLGGVTLARSHGIARTHSFLRSW